MHTAFQRHRASESQWPHGLCGLHAPLGLSRHATGMALLLGLLAFWGMDIWLLAAVPSARKEWEGWVGFIILGLMPIFYFVYALWERLSKRPAIIIMDDKVVCQHGCKRQEFLFADIERFELDTIPTRYGKGLGVINVHYRKYVPQSRIRHYSEMGGVDRGMPMLYSFVRRIVLELSI